MQAKKNTHNKEVKNLASYLSKTDVSLIIATYKFKQQKLLRKLFLTIVYNFMQKIVFFTCNYVMFSAQGIEFSALRL